MTSASRRCGFAHTGLPHFHLTVIGVVGRGVCGHYRHQQAFMIDIYLERFGTAHECLSQPHGSFRITFLAIEFFGTNSMHIQAAKAIMDDASASSTYLNYSACPTDCTRWHVSQQHKSLHSDNVCKYLIAPHTNCRHPASHLSSSLQTCNTPCLELYTQHPLVMHIEHPLVLHAQRFLVHIQHSLICR